LTDVPAQQAHQIVGCQPTLRNEDLGCSNLEPQAGKQR
jgi:hypothetical protein